MISLSTTSTSSTTAPSASTKITGAAQKCKPMWWLIAMVWSQYNNYPHNYSPAEEESNTFYYNNLIISHYFARTSLAFQCIWCFSPGTNF